MTKVEDSPAAAWIQPASAAPPIVETAQVTPELTPVRNPASAKKLLGNVSVRDDDSEVSFLEERQTKAAGGHRPSESSADTDASTKAIADREPKLILGEFEEELAEPDSDDEYFDSLKSRRID